MNELLDYIKEINIALFAIIIIVSLLNISLIIIIIYFFIRYNNKKNPQATIVENTKKTHLVSIGIITIFVIGLCYFRYLRNKSAFDFETPVSVKVNGEVTNSNWTFKYDNGEINDTLYIPVNLPVKLSLFSSDVLYKIFIPAFKLTQDIIPGQDKFLILNPHKEGKYELLYADKCNLDHFSKHKIIVAIPKQEFNQWYINTAENIVTFKTSPENAGFNVLKKYGCNTCHSADGTKLAGTSFKGFYDKTKIVITNTREREIKVDKKYIIKSIYNPDTDIVKGYDPGIMISYNNKISEKEIDLIIEYLKNIND